MNSLRGGLVFFSILILSLPFAGFTKEVDGRIVTLKGDTLRGKIDYLSWNNNPTTITFYGSDGVMSRFTAADIHGFEIEKIEIYRSLYVKTIYTGKEMMGYGEVDKGEQINSLVFARVLVSGDKLSLYSFRKNNIDNFYISTPDKPEPERLLNTRVLVDNGSAHGAYYDKMEYKNQLRPYATNAKLQKELNTLYFGAGDLTKFVLHSNGNVEELSSLKELEGRRYAYPFIGGGVAISKMNSANEDVKSIARMKFSASTSPLLQFGYNLLGKRANNQLSAKILLGFNYFKTQGSFTDNLSGAVATETWNLELFEVSPTIMGFYNFSGQQYKRFEIGAAVGSVIYSENVNERGSSLTNPDGSAVKRAAPELAATSFRFSLLGNIQFMKTFSVLVSYSPSMSFAGIDSKRDQLGLSVLFYLTKSSH